MDTVLALGTMSVFLNGLDFCPLHIPFLALPGGILCLFFSLRFLFPGAL